MATGGQLSTAQLLDVFTREVTALGGLVNDVYNDGKALLARSVLPWSVEVRQGDAVFPGVAIRAAGPTVALHPYVFREVCKNGSIMA